MGVREQTTVRFDSVEQDHISDFQETHGLDSRSEAIRQMVQIAYRESRHPIAHRFKDELVRWSGNLGIFAILALLAGFTTPVLSPADAAVFAIGLAATAVVLLGGMELARVAGGYNELGVGVRELIREVKP